MGRRALVRNRMTELTIKQDILGLIHKEQVEINEKLKQLSEELAAIRKAIGDKEHRDAWLRGLGI